MVESNDRPVIGLSSATANQPNSSDAFSFWLAPEVIVNPFDIVEAEQVALAGASRTFGIVTTLDHSTDASFQLHLQRLWSGGRRTQHGAAGHDRRACRRPLERPGHLYARDE